MINITRANREAMTRLLDTVPDHYRPIVLAVRDHQCGYAMVLQDAGPFTLPLNSTRPAIVVLGDDLFTSKGPDAFDAPSLEVLIKQCESAFVIASEAVETTYALACFGPVQLRKTAVLVETLPAHEDEWIDLIREIKPDIRMVISKVDPLARPAPQTWGRA